MVAVPAQSALAARDGLTLNDLLGQPLVIFPRNILPSLYDAIFAMYHAAGQLPRVAQEAIQMQTIVNLVSAGLGIAWVPESVRQFQRPGVVYRSVSPGKPPGRAVGKVTVRVGETRSAQVARREVPGCETSLVWSSASVNPVLKRFVAFIGCVPR